MKNLSVMLVEDNADDEYLAIRTLNKAGVTNITVTRDGAEAVRLLLGQEQSGDEIIYRPDLIFLDLRLPKLDGIDVLRTIRASEQTKFIRVVVLTSAEDPFCKQICHDLAVIAYLTKPLDVADVARLCTG